MISTRGKGCLLTVLVLIVSASAAAGNWKEKVLHSFTGGDDGRLPFAGLTIGMDGYLYGTASLGGLNNAGVIFKIDTSGKQQVLYSFSGGADGGIPYGALTVDQAGNFYGTASDGGAYGVGVVYKLTSTGKFKVLYAFTGGADGGRPHAVLIRDEKGNLYGTTARGGADCDGTGFGCGTVFKLTPKGKEVVLHAFEGGEDGNSPVEGLIRDAAGNFYGSTTIGGDSCNCGVVYKLTTKGKESILHTFIDGTDGANPNGLISDSSGNLYGTTGSGGMGCGGGTYGCGTIFKITPKQQESVLYAFTGGSNDGSTPTAGLIQDQTGALYGTTVAGGSCNCGTVFRFSAGSRETVLHDFADTGDGNGPGASLVMDDTGRLYGTTEGGGTFGQGTVFKMTN